MANVNTVSNTNGVMSAEMMSFYDKNLIAEAQSATVHDQFAQKRTVPKNRGKAVEFMKLSPLEKAMKPLTEGITPDGNKLTWSKVTAELEQYGDYVTLSDMFITTEIDNNLVEAGVVLGNQAGETLDAITREVICGGTNVMYESGALARHLLAGGEPEGNNYLSVDSIKKAVRTLKRNKAKKINGSYVAIIHPDAAYDLMNDPKWENVKTYADAADMYNGEIGRLYGVRFVESSEAKIFTAADLSSTSRELNATASSGKAVTLSSTLTEDDAAKLAGRMVIIGGMCYTVASASAGSAGGAKLTLEEEPVSAVSTSTAVYPGEAGAKGRDVYATLVIGADAYGVTELEDGGLKNIIKQLGSGGSSDPLDQRATTGWKAVRAAEILVDEYLVRIESASSFEN